MAIGIVKFFHLRKGFGFIIPEGGGKDIFVHSSDVELAGMSALAQGQSLSFETELDGKGAIKAVGIKPNLVAALMQNATKEFPKASNNNEATPRSKNVPKRNRETAHIVPTFHADETARPEAKGKSSEWQRSYNRFCELARNSGDDLVARESLWQHAEHFLRLINGSAT
jgi:CspA family cold shock protein